MSENEKDYQQLEVLEIQKDLEIIVSNFLLFLLAKSNFSDKNSSLNYIRKVLIDLKNLSFVCENEHIKSQFLDFLFNNLNNSQFRDMYEGIWEKILNYIFQCEINGEFENLQRRLIKKVEYFYELYKNYGDFKKIFLAKNFSSFAKSLEDILISQSNSALGFIKIFLNNNNHCLGVLGNYYLKFSDSSLSEQEYILFIKELEKNAESPILISQLQNFDQVYINDDFVDIVKYFVSDLRTRENYNIESYQKLHSDILSIKQNISISGKSIFNETIQHFYELDEKYINILSIIIFYIIRRKNLTNKFLELK